jgi:heat shock protein HslJ
MLRNAYPATPPALAAALPITLAISVAFSVSLIGCQDMPPTTPAYVPANATPPVVTAASDQLVGPEWHWQRTQLGGAPAVTPSAPDRYTLSFQGGGRVNVRADCNRGSGSYEVNGAQFKLGAMALTKMACPPGSLDAEFLRSLAQATAFSIDRGVLVLTLADGASMRFRPVQLAAM